MINNKTVEEKKQNSTDTTVPGSIIIAPHIESMDVTIVMGDQKSSCMNFNGGEACVEDPYDDGFGMVSSMSSMRMTSPKKTCRMRMTPLWSWMKSTTAHARNANTPIAWSIRRAGKRRCA